MRATLPAEMRLFRFEVVESFLSGGIALAKVDALRPLLEKYGHRLTNRAHLSELIPAVLEKVFIIKMKRTNLRKNSKM